MKMKTPDIGKGMRKMKNEREKIRNQKENENRKERNEKQK